MRKAPPPALIFRYPITLNWAYFGPAPTLSAVSITTADGTPILHEANKALPAGHKGLQIKPSANLPPNTTLIVTVEGAYNGAPFAYSWQFTTGASGE